MKDILATVCEKLVELDYLDANEVEEITSFTDTTLQAAVARFQKADGNVDLKRIELGEESSAVLGVVDQATFEILTAKIHCGCHGTAAAMPEGVDEKAVGGGNWRECHGVNGFHTCLYLVDSRRRPSWMPPEQWREILRITQKYGDEIGLHSIYVDSESWVDIITGETIDQSESVEGFMEFAHLSGGAIGLGIVGDGYWRCDSGRRRQMWVQLDPRYRPQHVLSEWPTLVAHEQHWHNGGCRWNGNAHFTGVGSVASPSIQTGRKGWLNDPAGTVIKSLYGGVAHPGWGSVPTPDDPVDPLPPNGDDLPPVGSRLSSSFDYKYGNRTLNAAIVRMLDKPGR